jgi:hypothetical protein
MGEWRGMRRPAARLGLGGLAASAALMTAAASAWAVSSPDTSWHVVYRSYAKARPVFLGVTATGPRHAWVLAQTGSTYFVLQRNGRAWAGMSPVPGHLVLGQIAASSATDVWLFGAPAGSPGSVAVHWNGASWTTMSLPNVPTSYVVAASPSDVWVASDAHSLLHWDGASWQQSGYEFPGWQPLATAGGRIWRVDSGRIGGHAHRLIVRRWNGVRWQLVGSPHPDVGLRTSVAISAASPDNIWIEVPVSGGHGRPFLLHWDGAGWKRIAEPAVVLPYGSIAAVGRAGVWVRGGQARWTGRRWIVRSPDCIAAMAGQMTGVPTTESALCISALSSAPHPPAEILQAGTLP